MMPSISPAYCSFRNGYSGLRHLSHSPACSGANEGFDSIRPGLRRGLGGAPVTGSLFPLYPGKQTFPAVTDPGEHAAYVQTRQADATLAGRAGVVLLYQRAALRDAYARFDARPLEGWVRGDLGLIEHDGRAVGICGGFGLSTPAAGAGLVLEKLLALSTERVITVGPAAALQPDLCTGDVAVCTRALRDEGLSRHYLPRPATPVRPSRSPAPSWRPWKRRASWHAPGPRGAPTRRTGRPTRRWTNMAPRAPSARAW